VNRVEMANKTKAKVWSLVGHMLAKSIRQNPLTETICFRKYSVNDECQNQATAFEPVGVHHERRSLTS